MNRWRDFAVRGAISASIVVLMVDAFSTALTGSTAEVSLLDEPAHLATAALLLFTLVVFCPAAVSIPFLTAALIASVAIDVDHVPEYLGWNGLTEATPRPYTHSLVVPVVLLLVALASEKIRQVALGAAFGVCAHLFRDLATGSGVALFWPASTAGIRIPYLIYAATLVSCVAAVLVVALSRPCRRSTVTEPSQDFG